MNVDAFSKVLGHAFANPALLDTALTHRSFGAQNNERLEFIGDGILNFVIAVALFQRYKDLPEGELSRLRANLVRQESLHRIALTLNLGNYLRLGEGELRSGGASRPSILADALEAVFGAVYLDAGFERAKDLILGLYDALLEEHQPGKSGKDAKTRLQEWLQARKKSLPKYRLKETSGAAHAQHFSVVCEIEFRSLNTQGEGSSRRLAEQAAAENALRILEA